MGALCSECANDQKGTQKLIDKPVIRKSPASKPFRIGILQINVKATTVQGITIGARTLYGIGVCVDSYSFITLTRYFVNNAELRIFAFDFRTFQFPITNTDGFIVYDVESDSISNPYMFGSHKVFMKLKLKSENAEQTFHDPILLSRKQTKRDCKGFVLGIPNYKNLRLQKRQFRSEHISKLRLQYSAALIFMLKQGDLKLYGIYDALNQFGKEDYYLSSFSQQTQKIEQQQQQVSQHGDFQNEAYIVGRPQLQQIKIRTKFPYCSIGLLYYKTQKIIGTASVLFDKKNKVYKHLITCAHNFYGCKFDKQKKQFLINDFRSNKKDYTFRLPSQEIREQPDRYMAVQDQQNFKIKQVNIPHQYQRQIDYIQNNQGSVSFKQLQEAYNKARRFDLAIVQLQSQISIKKGFRVSLFQKHLSHQQSNIEVTGFPVTYHYHTIVLKQYTSSTAECNGPSSLVMIQGRVQGQEYNRTIKHELSTLQGNSGSPIYQQYGQRKNIYIFGIHTGGKGESTSVQGQFLRLNTDLDKPTFGYLKLSSARENVGTYLYNNIIYKWYLQLPGIHSVTKHYAQLISHLAFLQLGNNQYGLGFLTGLNKTKYIAFSRSYNSIKRVIIRKHSKIERGDNILEFSLQQQSSDKFHLLPRATQFYTSLFGLNGLTIQDDSVQQHFGSTKHASGYLNQSDRLTVRDILGIKVILKRSNHLWKLVFQPFKAQEIFNNNNASNPPAFYFVYDFLKNVLIWAFK